MKISDLVNKVEPFRFEYDGFVLEGEWYKYKTTTPKYNEVFDKKLAGVTDGDDFNAEDVNAMRGSLHQALADCIKSWNAEDREGEAIPVTAEVFHELPEPFTQELAKYFKSLRDVNKNPTSPSSPST